MTTGKMLGKSRRGRGACACWDCFVAHHGTRSRRDRRRFQKHPQRRWEDRQWRREET